MFVQLLFLVIFMVFVFVIEVNVREFVEELVLILNQVKFENLVVFYDNLINMIVEKYINLFMIKEDILVVFFFDRYIIDKMKQVGLIIIDV